MAPTIAYTLPAINVVVNIILPGGILYNNTNADSGSNLKPLPIEVQSTIRIPDGYVVDGLNNASTGPAKNQSTILPEGYVAHPDIGTAYKISEDKVTWEEGRKRCLAEGANLAVTDTNLKLAFLIDKATGPVLVGIQRSNNTEWISATDGSTLTNLPWAASNPDNETANDLVFASTATRGLHNFKHTYLAYFACEIPIIPRSK